MRDWQLIAEKLVQATAVLDEFDVDVWLTFVRKWPCCAFLDAKNLIR